MKIKLIYLFLVIILGLISLIVTKTKAYDVSVFINEFMPDPQGSDTGKEWIEIFNLNNYSIILDNWKIKNISSANSLRTFDLSGAVIQPNSFLIIADSNLASTTQIYYLSSGSLNMFNTNSRLELYDSNNNLIQSLSYTNSEEEKSWELNGPLCNNLFKNSAGNSIGNPNVNFNSECWPGSIETPVSYPISTIPESYPASTQPTSYPINQNNDDLNIYRNIIITEIYPSPNTGESEWIEIYNTSLNTIDLTSINVKELNSQGEYVNSTNLEGLIPAGGYILIDKLKLTLNNSGDQIGLFFKENLLNEVKYPSIPKGNSYSRIFKSIYTQDWFITENITPLMQNSSDEPVSINIQDVKTANLSSKYQISGCISLINTVMPTGYLYIQDLSAGVKLRFSDTPDLNIGDCIVVNGNIIQTNSERYFKVINVDVLSRNNLDAININSNSDYKYFEGMHIKMLNIKILRKYSYSLLLENGLKMKYSEDFDSSEFISGDEIDIDGVILKLSGVYYIYPLEINHSSSVMGIINKSNGVFSYPVSYLQKDIFTSTTSQKVLFKIKSWILFLILWIIANIIFIASVKSEFINKVANSLLKRLKYEHASNTNYFGKDIFNRNFSEKVS